MMRVNGLLALGGARRGSAVPIRPLWLALVALLVSLAGAVPASAEDEAPTAPNPAKAPETAKAPDAAKDPKAAGDQPVERWYERRLRGQKAGHLHVTWSPSTWQGKPTLRDSTTIVQDSTRSMAGMRDRFSSTITIELERDADGRLWWQRVQVEEAGRISVEELTWTGSGYAHVSRLGDVEKRLQVALDKPVMTDGESFAGPLLRDGSLRAGGESVTFPMLDLRSRGAATHELSVLETTQRGDDDEDDHGTGATRHHLLERHARSRAETHLWLDEQGALVRLATEGGLEIVRTSRAQAEEIPQTSAEYAITVPAQPQLERIFGADRVRVDMHVQHDATRRLPELPPSPWTKTLGVDGSEKDGWVIHLEMHRHAGTGKTATLPVEANDFERDLEGTVLMPKDHEAVQELARSIVGDETDARRASFKLSRWVYTELSKQSPRVAQASALEIIEQRRGDCSEHALLFVTLCRAVGIPARRCSGYVCIGSLWGSHAWAEIWTGEWIAADPTTGEVAPGARYLFFGYPDREGSYPGLVTSRISGRIRLVTTHLQEGQAEFDLTDRATHRRSEPDQRRYLHVLAGLEAREVPEDWEIRLSGSYRMQIVAPEWEAQAFASGHQGADLKEAKGHGGAGALETTFGGAPALTTTGDGTFTSFIVFSRGRVVRVLVRSKTGQPVGATALAQLEFVLAPTFKEPAMAWDTPSDSDAPSEPDAR